MLERLDAGVSRPPAFCGRKTYNNTIAAWVILFVHIPLRRETYSSVVMARSCRLPLDKALPGLGNPDPVPPTALFVPPRRPLCGRDSRGSQSHYFCSLPRHRRRGYKILAKVEGLYAGVAVPPLSPLLATFLSSRLIRIPLVRERSQPPACFYCSDRCLDRRRHVPKSRISLP